jgi:hypothetical protein
MASRTSRTASWTTVASHAAIPLGRVFPGPVGIGTRRRGCWRYRGAFRRACRLWRCASRSRPDGSFVTPSTPTAASARGRRYARARAGPSLRCASAWHRPSGSRGARSTPFTSPGDMAAHVAAVGLGPSCSAPQHGPPVLDRGRVPPRAPASPLVCRPPTPCPHRLRLRFPVPGAYLEAGACSMPLRPTTRAPAHLSCVGDGAPVLRATGMGRGEARASQVPGPSSSSVPWSTTPPDTIPSSPTHAGGAVAFEVIQPSRPPGRLEVSGPPTPWPARSQVYASPRPLLPPSPGWLPARAGSPLAGQDAHLLDDTQSFMESSHPPIPFDQHCLVALYYLYSELRHPFGNYDAILMHQAVYCIN